MTQPIIRADRRYRKKLLILYALFVLVVILLIGWVLPWSKAYLLQLELETALTVMKVVLAVMFLSFVPAGLYVWRLGRKIMVHERFPPPGVKVMKDTKLIEGKRARVRGRVLIVFSLVLILFGLFAAFYFPYRVNKFTSPGLPIDDTVEPLS
jgi:ATP/ADP translocase